LPAQTVVPADEERKIMNAAAQRALSALLTNQQLQRVAEEFLSAGRELFLVGGSVRDAISGVAEFDDLDCTTDALPSQIREIVASLGPVWDVGVRFGTIGVEVDGEKVEITTYRSDQYDAESRKPTVFFSDRIEDDLARRDLTINAMAVALVGTDRFRVGEVIDPFGGCEDLRDGIIRTPSDPERTLTEDPLRVLRVIRFCVTSSKPRKPAPELGNAILRTRHRLAIVSAERKAQELRKIMRAGGPATAAALRLSERFGLRQGFLEGLRDDRPAQKLVEQLAPEQVLAGMVFASGEQAAQAMRRLRLTSKEQQGAKKAAKIARSLGGSPSRIVARRLVREQPDEILRAALAVAKAAGGLPPSGCLGEMLAEELLHAKILRQPLPVTGNDLVSLGLSGPAIGKALRQVTTAFLLNPELTQSEAIEEALSISSS
jgi:tRNA nucleotidyltransferase/poly(A) polymerase